MDLITHHLSQTKLLVKIVLWIVHEEEIRIRRIDDQNKQENLLKGGIHVSQTIDGQ